MTEQHSLFEIGSITTFELVSITVNDHVKAAEMMKMHNFDVVPIKKGSQIASYFSNSTLPYDKQITIDEIVPASLSFEKSLAILQEGNRWRFVLGEDSKLGIVTAADFQKIPVRVVLFREISQLEVSLNNTFDELNVGDKSLDEVEELHNLKKSKNYQERAKKANAEQRLYFYLSIKDKLTLLRHLHSINETIRDIPDLLLNKIEEVGDLRDSVSHSKFIQFNQVPGILREMKELREKLDELCCDKSKQTKLD